MQNHDIESKHDSESKAAPHEMTEEEMFLAVKDDPDAAPLTESMLNHFELQQRLDRSRPKRVAAARALIEEYQREKATKAEAEKTR